MKKGTVIVTKTIDTPHGPKLVAAVTYAGKFYGRKNYFSHKYNSLAQRISGGCMFVEGSEIAKRYGI